MVVLILSESLLQNFQPQRQWCIRSLLAWARYFIHHWCWGGGQKSEKEGLAVKGVGMKNFLSCQSFRCLQYQQSDTKRWQFCKDTLVTDRREGTTKNLCDKDIAELSGELSSVISSNPGLIGQYSSENSLMRLLGFVGPSWPQEPYS